MKEKLIIDEKVCLKHKMTLPEVLTALAIRSIGSLIPTLEKMKNREILVYDSKDEEYYVTQHWSDVLDEILCDSGGAVDEKRLMELAVKIQEIFPSGFHQRNGTGTRHYFKGSRKEIAQALKKFISYYGDYPDEEILWAAKKYVADCRGDYGYLRTANYFVIKDERRNGGDITSELAKVLENKGSEEKMNTNSDWTNKMI